MQCNYDFHLHHCLFDGSQMLEEFESFHCNGNVNNISWYGKLNISPAPHLIWGINYQIQRKEFLTLLKSFYGESRRFLLVYLLFEKVSGPMSSKVDVIKFL